MKFSYKPSRIIFKLKWKLVMLAIVCTSMSCKKEWLDEKPKKSLAIPSTISDYQALLSSNFSGTGGGFNDSYGMLAELASADFSISDVNFNNGPKVQQNAYSWAADLYGGTESYSEWILPYRQVYYTNIVLEGIEKIVPTSIEISDWNHVKGTALFFRAFGHYDIVRQFCKPYNKATATSDLGIPLRLNSDFSEKSVRSSVEQSYSQIISDLKTSAALLPIPTPINDRYKVQPTKAAAYAMLARVYLTMSNYDSAWAYADKSLQLYNTLLDYNSVVAIGPFTSFQQLNPEMLFYKRGNQYSFLIVNRAFIDINLFNLYDQDDLRKSLFFRTLGANKIFIGSYDGTINQLFTGLATDEIYLIRAECYARFNQKTEALTDLNTLLEKRYKTGLFVPITATDANDALRKILIERRKELLFRSIRWEDLRRLNLDPVFAVTLTRTINGQSVTLQPNSALYVFPIPESVIRLTGMPQNPR